MINAVKYMTITVLLCFGTGLSAQPLSDSYAIGAVDAAYADIADLVVIAPMIVDAKIRKTTKIPAAQAIGVPPSRQRSQQKYVSCWTWTKMRAAKFPN
jgi:hypothetical protein